MKYIVDTNVFRTFFRFYYNDITPELFNNLDSMIREGKIISVKEVYHELENQHKKDSDFMNNIKVYKNIFQEPTNEEEIEILKQIYSKRNYQNNISEKNLLNGNPVADAFLVAKAKCENGILVTAEEFSPNAARIPNICEEFNIKYISFKEFLKIVKKYKL